MKRRSTPLFLVAFVALMFSSCREDSDIPVDSLDGELTAVLEDAGGTFGLNKFRLPDSHEYFQMPSDPLNPVTQVKISLGQKLFHETALGTNPLKNDMVGTFSCASCHISGSAFQAGIPQGMGEGGLGIGLEGEGRFPNPDYLESEIDVLPIRVPSVINVGYNRTATWDGKLGAQGANQGFEDRFDLNEVIETNMLGYQGVETQAIAGLTVHRMKIELGFVGQFYYEDLFNLAFPDFPEGERVTTETAGLAIAAYERALLANRAPFQQWIRGDQGAMTDNQKLGALLFFGKAGCSSCHDGPALNSEDFFALGMKDIDQGGDMIGDFPDFENVRLGRGFFTGLSSDNYKFKVPQLYGLRDMKFLGHGASFESVREVIEYKNAGIPENGLVPENALANEFVPLGLSTDEIDALTDFVANALYDAEMERYVPDHIASGNCFPNNDEVSRVELGCE